MKLIIRADDVGYSVVANLGTMKAIDEGVVTSADVMLDCRGAVDALEQLKKRPWISVGWHSNHFWGKPVLPAERVPSLINEKGDFVWAVKDGLKLGGVETPPSPQEINRRKNAIVYQELIEELRAEVLLCLRVYGSVPVTCTWLGDTLVEKAKKQVCDEFGIKYGWFAKGPGGKNPNGAPADPAYQDLDIFMPFQLNGTNKYMLDPPGAFEPEKYDPIPAFESDADGILGHKIAQVAFHPGYVDEYLANDGGIQFVMNRVRVLDVIAMCDPRLRDWIKRTNIELVNQHDALYGTRAYQNHLRETGSDLYVSAS